MPRGLQGLFWVCSFLEEGLSRRFLVKKVTDGKRKRPCEVPMTILHKVLISNFLVGFQGMGTGCEKVSFLTVFRMPSFVPWHVDYSHSLRSTFPRFLFPLGYGGLKRVLACKFVFFSVFPQFSKLWVSNWYHSLVSFRLKNRLGKSDYSFQKSDTWTGTHWSVALRLKVTRRSCSSWSIFIVAQNKWLCNDGNV